MALPKAYLTTAKNLPAILNAIQGAKAPPKFTTRFLESLEFKNAADRLIIGVLKTLGFLNDDGIPTQRYFDFLDQTRGAKVLAEGIREAYDDLFSVNTTAQTLTRSDLINKFKTLSQGQLSESVLDKMVLTFTELCKLADFSAPIPSAENTSQAAVTSPTASKVTTPTLKVGGLIYNIQIHLPESRDQAVYDALFRSLREHLG